MVLILLHHIVRLIYTIMNATILTEPYQLTQEQIHFYQQHKYIKLKQVLDAPTLMYSNAVISKKVAELNKVKIHN